MAKQPPRFDSLYEARIMAADGATLKHEWIYLDYESREAFRVLAYESCDGGVVETVTRTLWPASPWEDGWRMDEPPGPWPLYRLPELPRFGRVYVCQNESAADAMRWAGLPATSSAHGCHAVHKTDWAPLAGTDVIIVPDNDPAGPIYARTAAAALDRLMPSALGMRVLELPGLPANGDILHFLTAPQPGSTTSIAERIESLADRALHWEEYCRHDFPASPSRHAKAANSLPQRGFEEPPHAPLDVPEPASPPHVRPAGGGSLPALSETHSDRRGQESASSPQTIDWLWPARFALGDLNLLLLAPADPLLALDLAARVSTGAPWPDSAGQAPRGSVVLVNFPDAHPDVTRRLLDKAGADMTRIIAAAAARRTPDSPHLPAIAAIRRAIHQIGDVHLVLIDRAADYLGRHPRAALDALKALAAERELAIILLHRLPANPGGPTRLRVRAGRSLEMAAAAWLAIPDPQAPARKLLLPINEDLLPSSPGLAYRVIDGRLAWEPVPTPPSTKAVLRASGKKPGPPSAAQRAALRWLRQRLSLGPAYAGHVRQPDAKSLRQEADDAGHAWSTVRRALREIGAVRERCGETGKSVWRVT